MTLLTPKMEATADLDEDLQSPSDLDLPSATTREDEDALPSPDQQVKIWVPFDMDSPYPTTGDELDVQYKRTRDFLRCNERYLTPPQAHDQPTSAAMASLLRNELTAIFHGWTARKIRIQRLETLKWRQLQGMSAFDETQPTLPRDYFHRRAVGDFFNKHIAIYFQRTQNDPEDWFYSRGTNVSSDVIGRYCYRHWLRMHGGRAPFQRRHFLAKAIEFKVQRCKDGNVGKHYSTKNFVTDLPYVLEFHRSLCNSVAAREEDVFAPSYDRRGLGHLFRSLVMVVDGQSKLTHDYIEEPWLATDYQITPPDLSVITSQTNDRIVYTNAPMYYDDAERWMDWLASHQRVLLVKTGDESHLSAPISFLPLFDAGKAVPVDREDCDGSGEVAVRVRLDHALEFIEDLIRREEKAVPHVGRAAQALEDELEQMCEQWVATVLRDAARVGVDNHGVTWQAIRRAWARMNGEAFEEDQVSPDWELIRRWFPGG